jgi:uncharacterized membrane protein YhhN
MGSHATVYVVDGGGRPESQTYMRVCGNISSLAFSRKVRELILPFIYRITQVKMVLALALQKEIHLGAALGACALGLLATLRICDNLGILHDPLGFALDAICFVFGHCLYLLLDESKVKLASS